MNIKSAEDVRSATLKDLVEFWNSRNTEEPITKFASRKTAEAKVIGIIEMQKDAHKRAVAETWKDPAVAAARNSKDGVLVAYGGFSNSFKSTREAFDVLSLPMSKCIRFRGGLKAKGRAIFSWDGVDYKFFIDITEESNTKH